jgi:hypothetical protein
MPEDLEVTSTAHMDFPRISGIVAYTQ